MRQGALRVAQIQPLSESAVIDTHLRAVNDRGALTIVQDSHQRVSAATRLEGIHGVFRDDRPIVRTLPATVTVRIWHLGG